MKLNLGCGPIQPAGWVNVDGSNRAFLASRLSWLNRALERSGLLAPTEFGPHIVYADLLREFPWTDGSADAVYLGEVLEHFTQVQGEHILHQCFRVLKPGGRLRVRVPDNARFWSRYLEEYERVRLLPRASWSAHHGRFIKMYFDDLCVRRPKPWQSMGHFHKWMYDEVSLTLLFESVGFRQVERCAFHESAIAGIAAVENRDDLIIEGLRP